MLSERRQHTEYSIKFHIKKILANGNLAYNSDRKQISNCLGEG